MQLKRNPLLLCRRLCLRDRPLQQRGERLGFWRDGQHIGLQPGELDQGFNQKAELLALLEDDLCLLALPGRQLLLHQQRGVELEVCKWSFGLMGDVREQALDALPLPLHPAQ